MPRSPAEAIRIESRRVKVAELYLHGMRSLTRIAKELKVDKAQISRDFKHIRKMWQKACIKDLHVAYEEELAKIAEIEEKAWLAWDRSCQVVETMEVTGTTQGGKSNPNKVRKVSKGQAGNVRFLQLALDCVTKRSNLLGLWGLDLQDQLKELHEHFDRSRAARTISPNGDSTVGTDYWRN